MKFFEKYTSNSCAGSGNQYFFNLKENEIRCGRVFYRIEAGGTYGYSILFSNVIDSTFSDGSVSHSNLICDSWEILGARIGKCTRINPETFTLTQDGGYTDISMGEEGGSSERHICVGKFRELTFNGSFGKQVAPGEFFASDPVEMYFEKGEYLCLEVTFRGKMIPYHEESILPAYVKTENGWRYGRQVVFAGMIGCDRKVKARIGYLGDSITQGIGVAVNSYDHWNARLSQLLGREYAYWNLGLGFGRAADAASDGAWLFKAKQNDYVVVCYGVNDLMNGRSVKEICADLTGIARKLRQAGVKVLVQTVPPFDYEDENIAKWQQINKFIQETLVSDVEGVFDVTAVLSLDAEHPQTAKYGGHPNGEGCALWAQQLYPAVNTFLKP